ncbi:MAG: outer membrane protein assembly factor BamB family protein [Planctomycetota bacterium]|jgi:outer membrane protein assembly factor BamB
MRSLMTTLFVSALVPLSGCAANNAFADAAFADEAAAVDDRAWTNWRGPRQNGTSSETGLPASCEPGGPDELWTLDLAGRGTPAVANGRVYAMGYRGTGADLRELLLCLDERSGRVLWEHGFNDFLSDIIYDRYSIGAPTIDPETGNVYCLTTPGLLNCFSWDGRLLWQHSMMEQSGRLTFPNGRTGSPVVDGDLLITRGITTSWGSLGPARDRFYAFDKRTGDLVWASTPGVGPKDSCFSHPVIVQDGDRRLLYAGTGCGNIICIDAGTGAPVWRFQMSIGGVNSAVLVDEEKNRLIAVHGRENLDASEIGRMVALRLGTRPAAGEAGPVVLGTDSELWRTHHVAFTSPLVQVGDRVYLTGHTGELYCIDADTGEDLWKMKLAPDQIHAGPVHADGRLYVPMTNGTLHIIEPSDTGPNVVSQVQLEGSCLGPPAIAGGRVYVHTTEKLYCFGRESGTTAMPAPAPYTASTAGVLQVTPAEVLVQPGDTLQLNVRSNGTTEPARGISWGDTKLPVSIDEAGVLTVSADAAPGAAVITGVRNGVNGSIRVRVVPGATFAHDFENVTLAKTSKVDGGLFEFPPSHWIGAKLKWEVRDLDGDKVLAKTLDRPLFQRTQCFIGHPGLHDYTAQVDIRTDGNRRSMSSAGIINQRYIIQLKGNHQQLEITSNHERIKHHVPFRWRPGTWYRLKSRVETRVDGSVLVRAKAWPRDETEPDAWTIEFTHAQGHPHGAPGLYGFSPQSRFRVYLDNIMVTPND